MSSTLCIEVMNNSTSISGKHISVTQISANIDEVVVPQWGTPSQKRAFSNFSSLCFANVSTLNSPSSQQLYQTNTQYSNINRNKLRDSNLHDFDQFEMRLKTLITTISHAKTTQETLNTSHPKSSFQTQLPRIFPHTKHGGCHTCGVSFGTIPPFHACLHSSKCNCEVSTHIDHLSIPSSIHCKSLGVDHQPLDIHKSRSYSSKSLKDSRKSSNSQRFNESNQIRRIKSSYNSFFNQKVDEDSIFFVTMKKRSVLPNLFKRVVKKFIWKGDWHQTYEENLDKNLNKRRAELYFLKQKKALTLEEKKSRKRILNEIRRLTHEQRSCKLARRGIEIPEFTFHSIDEPKKEIITFMPKGIHRTKKIQLFSIRHQRFR